jgi:hypothetical protein
MKVNESPGDRIVRAVVGVVFLGLGVFAIHGWVGIVLDVLGVIALFTAATGFCLLYRLFGNFTTAKKA